MRTPTPQNNNNNQESPEFKTPLDGSSEKKKYGHYGRGMLFSKQEEYTGETPNNSNSKNDSCGEKSDESKKDNETPNNNFSSFSKNPIQKPKNTEIFSLCTNKKSYKTKIMGNKNSCSKKSSEGSLNGNLTMGSDRSSCLRSEQVGERAGGGMLNCSTTKESAKEELENKNITSSSSYILTTNECINANETTKSEKLKQQISTSPTQNNENENNHPQCNNFICCSCICAFLQCRSHVASLSIVLQYQQRGSTQETLFVVSICSGLPSDSLVNQEELDPPNGLS